MFLKLLILSSVFISIAALGLAIRILAMNHGEFPETHISRNKEMKKRGITCAQQTDTGCHSTDGFPGCSTCSGNRLITER
jgi:hypothetical protein